MSISIPSINAGVYLGLGKPDESVIELDEIHYEVRDVVTRLTKQLRNSDENQVLSVTGPFVPNVSPYDVTSLIGSSEIAWLERYDNQRWVPVRMVNKSREQDWYESGVDAAAAYGDGDGNRYIEFAFNVAEIATTQYRIQYDADAVPTSLSVDDILIPDSFQPMFEMESQQGCIIRIKRNIAERAENDVERRTLQFRLATWDDAFAYNEKRLRIDWRPLWRTHVYRKTGVQGSRGRLPAKSGRGFYGGR